MTSMVGTDHGGTSMSGMSREAKISPDANRVPGFPQDAYMESPMMAMDAAVSKPENYGLAPGWSGYMQGMMTLVRVFRPAEFDKIMAMIRTNGRKAMPNTPGIPNMPGMNHRG
jgi:hypothetical protein